MVAPLLGSVFQSTAFDSHGDARWQEGKVMDHCG